MLHYCFQELQEEELPRCDDACKKKHKNDVCPKVLYALQNFVTPEDVVYVKVKYLNFFY